MDGDRTGLAVQTEKKPGAKAGVRHILITMTSAGAFAAAPCPLGRLPDHARSMAHLSGCWNLAASAMTCLTRLSASSAL
jgi:hypothetical protein